MAVEGADDLVMFCGGEKYLRKFYRQISPLFDLSGMKGM